MAGSLPLGLGTFTPLSGSSVRALARVSTSPKSGAAASRAVEAGKSPSFLDGLQDGSVIQRHRSLQAHGKPCRAQSAERPGRLARERQSA